MTRASFARTALLVLFIAAAPTGAAAQLFDLTGSWSGTISCKTASSGVGARTTTTATLTVTQTGNAVGVRVDAGGTSTFYTGLANPDGKKPLEKGELALIRCGTDDVPGDALVGEEIGRFIAATKPPPTVKATVKGSSIVSGAETIGTCTWKWTRTALTTPTVPTSCPL